MWFDVSAAVMQLHEGGNCTLLSNVMESNAPNVIRITERIAPKVAEVAEVAAHGPQNLKSSPVTNPEGAYPDVRKYLDFLHLHGPSTYGACATAMGWGATRAWQAEAQLIAAGLVRYDILGKAVIEPD